MVDKSAFTKAAKRALQPVEISTTSNPPKTTRTQLANPNTDRPSKLAAEIAPSRRHLPDERPAVIHKFRVDTLEGYVTIGLFDDNRPAEVFIRLNHQDSLTNGLADTVAASLSIALQHGMPLFVWIRHFLNTRYEPAGLTVNSQIHSATSLTDYIARYLALRFLDSAQLTELGIKSETMPSSAQTPLDFTHGS